MIHTSGIPVTELLPHGPEMTVIDRLFSYDPKESVAIVAIGPEAKFFENGGVPAWVGIEYMAQTIAARAGFMARLRGERPAIGFLLGTREYESRIAEFPNGSLLRISVQPLWEDAGVGAFQCTIALDEIVATAVVSTYQPGADELARLRSAAGAA